MIDFPASPTKGTVYTPAGGPSYVFDGRAWLPAVPALRKVALIWCVAAREVGDEKLPVGVHGIMGSFYINSGGWNPGAGGAIVVPRSGLYLLRNRCYHNPAPTDPSGRVGILRNGAGTGNFVHLPSPAVASCTLEDTTVQTFTKGDLLQYEISVATAAVYTKFRHTEVQIYRLPDEWEAT